MREICTYSLLLLLGLGRVARGGCSTVLLGGITGGLAVRLGLADLPGDRLAATATRPLLKAPLFLLLLLLIGRLGHLDDHGAAIELLLVEELNGLLCGLCGSERNKTVTSRAVAAAHDDLSRKTTWMRKHIC